MWWRREHTMSRAAGAEEDIEISLSGSDEKRRFTTYSLNPSTGVNRPTVGGYSTLSRGLARALLAPLVVASGRP